MKEEEAEIDERLQRRERKRREANDEMRDGEVNCAGNAPVSSFCLISHRQS